jgi:hypothetical protein
MVDFKKHVKKRRSIDPTNLEAVFDSLDRHASHTELRPAQQQAVKEITERRSSRDLVLKMNTGTGKTAVALLFLQSHMEEKRKPVVYLCPTTQLVHQVCEEAARLGIRAAEYPRGEPHPLVEGTTAEAVIVCTYQKLFNGKSTFDRDDVLLRPCALVCDDAHAGVEEARDCFRMRIAGDDLHGKLIDLFTDPCHEYSPGLWTDIRKGDPLAALELPFWVWSPLISQLTSILSEHSQDESLTFSWPHLRDMLRWCRCVVSGAGIEIVPDVLPVEKIEAFVGAENRLFMSATLADDSVLVRDVGLDVDAANNPILPKKDKGLGERMVLAPSLISKDLDRWKIMELCQKLAKKVSVVVLTPNRWLADDWTGYGAKVVLGDDVSSVVTQLKEGAFGSSFPVFAQRYDGLDLPDNACRVLVIDGMPFGEGIADRYDSSLKSLPGGVRNRLIYRIEQGMGRAVRSPVDYAVVILGGADLAHFVAKGDVLDHMNPGTRAQLELALELAVLAREDGDDDPEGAFLDLIDKCLKRDDSWKQYYHEKARNFSKFTVSTSGALMLAAAEREASRKGLAKDPSGAAKTLQDACDSADPSHQQKAWYLDKIANYTHEFDPARALEIQRSAHEYDTTMACPPGTVKRPPAAGRYDGQTIIKNWLGQFANPNGAIAAIHELRARLSYGGTPTTMEVAIKDLAALIGATGSMPEKEFGEGPDDLWLWPHVSLVIEAKNQNSESLHKKDAGQLALSIQWFERQYPSRDPAVPLIVAKMAFADRKTDFPDETRVITPTNMNELLNALESMYFSMIETPLLYSEPSSIETLQTGLRLTEPQFVSAFTEPLVQK